MKVIWERAHGENVHDKMVVKCKLFWPAKSCWLMSDYFLYKTRKRQYFTLKLTLNICLFHTRKQSFAGRPCFCTRGKFFDCIFHAWISLIWDRKRSKSFFPIFSKNTQFFEKRTLTRLKVTYFLRLNGIWAKSIFWVWPLKIDFARFLLTFTLKHLITVVTFLTTSCRTL